VQLLVRCCVLPPHNWPHESYGPHEVHPPCTGEGGGGLLLRRLNHDPEWTAKSKTSTSREILFIWEKANEYSDVLLSHR